MRASTFLLCAGPGVDLHLNRRVPAFPGSRVVMAPLTRFRHHIAGYFNADAPQAEAVSMPPHWRRLSVASGDASAHGLPDQRTLPSRPQDRAKSFGQPISRIVSETLASSASICGTRSRKLQWRCSPGPRQQPRPWQRKSRDLFPLLSCNQRIGVAKELLPFNIRFNETIHKIHCCHFPTEVQRMYLELEINSNLNKINIFIASPVIPSANF